MEKYKDKCIKLCKYMEKLAKDNIAVAFSGGVDSSLLLKLAVKYASLNNKTVYAVTVVTQLQPMCDLQIAQQVVKEIGAQHVILKINELDKTGIRNNPIDRCYRCKKYIFENIKEYMRKKSVACIVEGTNKDDLETYRPGIKAIDELGIISPLKENDFTKDDVRKLALEYDISVADRPSAPCLATRFPYGETLNEEKMKNVEKGEQFLKKFALYNVRIRVHGEIVRIEIDGNDMKKLVDNRKQIISYLKELGYMYITLDLEGFRSGSMDIHL